VLARARAFAACALIAGPMVRAVVRLVASVDAAPIVDTAAGGQRQRRHRVDITIRN